MWSVGEMPSNFVAKGAEAYEASMGRWSRRLAAPFLKFSGVPTSGRVLDAGCGIGSLTFALSACAQLDSIEALDFEDQFVEALKSRATDARITARRGDVCALPYRNGEFDGVYSLLVLHFVSDARQAVREMHRVLRSGALGAAAVWSYDGMPSWRLFWDTVLAFEPEAAGNGVPSGRRPLTAAGELREVFESAGFARVEETMLTIVMDYVNFEDFWYPKVYGQGTFAAFFEALPKVRQDRLRDAMRSAYLSGDRDDGPREYASNAWAVRGARA